MSPESFRKALMFANYICETRSTLREAAKVFNVSKSCIHEYLNVHLPKIDLELFSSVRRILEDNKAEAPYRGGISTKRKYEALRRMYESADGKQERMAI